MVNFFNNMEKYVKNFEEENVINLPLARITLGYENIY